MSSPHQLTAVDHGTGTVTVHAAGCAEVASPHRVFDLDAASMVGAIIEIWFDEIAAGTLTGDQAAAATRWHECTGISA